MSLMLAYDTETTGLPLFDQPSDDPRQPHIVQLAALLADTKTRKVVASINMTAYPEGWEIPDEVANIHGITTEHAAQVGIRESFLVQCLWLLWERSDFRVAHNQSFDARIVRIALKRFYSDDQADTWKAGKAQCTARLASPIMKMAATPAMVASGRKYPKTPKLTEAFAHFIGKPMQDAHTALADAEACMRIWFAIRRQRKTRVLDGFDMFS